MESTNVQPTVWVGDGAGLVKEAWSSDGRILFIYLFYSFSNTLTSAVFRGLIKSDLRPQRLAEGRDTATLRYAKVAHDGICSPPERLEVTADTFQRPLKPGGPSEKNVWSLLKTVCFTKQNVAQKQA